MIDGKIFFNPTVKNSLRTYDNIGKNVTGQGNEYTTGYLIDHLYFKKYYKSMAIDLINNKN